MDANRQPQHHPLLAAASKPSEDETTPASLSETNGLTRAEGVASVGLPAQMAAVSAEFTQGPRPAPLAALGDSPQTSPGSVETTVSARRRLDAEPDDGWRPLQHHPKLGVTPEDRLPPELKPLPPNTVCASKKLTQAYALAFIGGPLVCLYFRRKTAIQYADVRDGLAEMFNAQVIGVSLLLVVFLTHRVLPLFLAHKILPGLGVLLVLTFYILWAIVAYQPIRGILKARAGQKYTSPFIVELIKPTDSYYRPRLISRGRVVPHQGCPESADETP